MCIQDTLLSIQLNQQGASEIARGPPSDTTRPPAGAPIGRGTFELAAARRAVPTVRRRICRLRPSSASVLHPRWC